MVLKNPDLHRNHPGNDASPSFSSNLGAVAFASDRDGAGDIYAVRLTDGSVVRLTGEGIPIRSLRWGPGSAQLLFAAERDGTTSLLVQGGPRRLTSSSARDFFPAWSPDPAP